MMFLKFAPAILLLSSAALFSQEPSPSPAPRPDAWTVHQPYANNPLRQATVAGSVSAAGETRPAQLQIECRAPEFPRFNLIFRAPGLKFNLDPFEGPPGIGQKQKFMRVDLDAHSPRAAFFSGFYVESDTFVFGVAPDRAEMTRLVSSASAAKPLHIHVSPADGKGEPLLFTFELPSANKPAYDVVHPCLAAKTKSREPIPQ